MQGRFCANCIDGRYIGGCMARCRRYRTRMGQFARCGAWFPAPGHWHQARAQMIEKLQRVKAAIDAAKGAGLTELRQRVTQYAEAQQSANVEIARELESLRQRVDTLEGQQRAGDE